MNEDDLQSVLSNAVTFKFGDSDELCNELLRLIRVGRKTATCEALRAFESGAEDMPAVGRRDVALNWDGSPALLLETLEVTHARFCDVEKDFALAEGENDDLAGWRRDHQAYFQRSGGFDEEMIVVCERFRVIQDFDK